MKPNTLESRARIHVQFTPEWAETQKRIEGAIVKPPRSRFNDPYVMEQHRRRGIGYTGTLRGNVLESHRP